MLLVRPQGRDSSCTSSRDAPVAPTPERERSPAQEGKVDPPGPPVGMSRCPLPRGLPVFCGLMATSHTEK